MQIIVGIRNGKFQFRGNNTVLAEFAPDETDKARAFCAERKLSEVMGSSTIDFPEDGGLSADFDARTWLRSVLYDPERAIPLAERLGALAGCNIAGRLRVAIEHVEADKKDAALFELRDLLRFVDPDNAEKEKAKPRSARKRVSKARA